MPAFYAFALISKGVGMGGRAVGSTAEIREMLDLTVKKSQALDQCEAAERGEPSCCGYDGE